MIPFDSIPLAGSPPTSPDTITNSPPLRRAPSLNSLVDANSDGASSEPDHVFGSILGRVPSAPDTNLQVTPQHTNESGRKLSNTNISSRRSSNGSDGLQSRQNNSTHTIATSLSNSPSRASRSDGPHSLDNAIHEEGHDLKEPQLLTRALHGVISAEVPVSTQQPSSIGLAPTTGLGPSVTRIGVDITRPDVPAKEVRVRSHSQRSSRQRPGVSSVSELLLEGLFAQFELQAARRITQFAVALPEEEAPRIDDLCGHGSDPNFDQLLFAMGSVVRTRPKPLVDKLMTWRHSYSSNTTMSSPTALALPATSEPTKSLGESVLPPRALGNGAQRHAALNKNLIIAERRSAAITYLLCRVLIEIFSQSDLQSITQELANRLEDIAYSNQLKSVTKEMLDKSPTKTAKWNLFSCLLGTMAEKDFDGVTSRFLADLQGYQRTLAVKGHGDKNVEEAAVLLLRGMRYIRLKVDVVSEFSNKPSSFLDSIADLFVNVHGRAVKLAYAQVISNLLLGCAGSPDMRYESTHWRRAVTTLMERFKKLSENKAKYWQISFSVQTILVCVAPYNTFITLWQPLFSSMPSRLKEKANRATVLKAACRLAWAYARRTPEKEFQAKNLEDIARAIFFSGKRYPLSAEKSIAAPAVELIRIIGARNLDLCFRSIILPLLNADVLLSNKDYKIEYLDPDRMVIGIRGFLAVMTDLEEHKHPLFPVFDDMEDFGIYTSFATANHHSRLNKGSGVSEAQMLKPIAMSVIPDAIKPHYIKFCEALGKVTLICDHAFGGQAMLDEKLCPVGPKTPNIDSWTFVRRDDGVSDERQAFFDLLHAAILALPRCSSPQIPMNNIVTLLCNGIAHMEKKVAKSSAFSLKSVARQGFAQYVVTRLSNHLQQLDVRLSGSDTSLIGPAHIEKTLSLYADLVNIWIDEIREKRKKPTSDKQEDSKATQRALGLDNSSIWTQIDRVESQSLLFLCSPLAQVRSYAIKLLELVAKFDVVHNQDNVRVASILREDYHKLIDPNDDNLNVGDRSRLQQGPRSNGSNHVLIDLCCSPNGEVDTSLWFKLFPRVLRRIFEACPMAATQTREDISTRLAHMHPMIDTVLDRARSHSVFESGPARSTKRSSFSATMIEQWKLYVVFVCTTLTRAGVNTQAGAQEPGHGRKSSKSSQNVQESFTTAIDLFMRVIPMLMSDNGHVRSAATAGLGSINLNLYRPLLESMEAVTQGRNEDTKKPQNTHQRGTSSPRRHALSERFRTEVAHVYQITSHFLQRAEVLKDEWILSHVADYTTELFHFLQREEGNHDYQQLRTHYCALVEAFFSGLNSRADPQKWMSFQTRRAAFTTLEDWCGHTTPRHLRESRSGNLRMPDFERHDLKSAANSAMATLCAGPIEVSLPVGRQTFDRNRMLSWIDGLLHNSSEKVHATGQRALKNLILHNPTDTIVLDECITKLYFTSFPEALESYLQVLSDILMSQSNVFIPYWQILSVLLCTLGHEESSIRMKSARLLRFFDESQPKQAKLQDLDISISDRTAAVYKKAQYEISQRLATRDDDDLAFNVFSESSKRYKLLQPDQQRNMVLAVLPWIKTINLQLDPNGGPTPASYMLLVNLFEITIVSTTSLHNEIQALWQALATGPHAGNVRLVLDFIIDLSLWGREQQYVEVARQIVVFLSSTPAGQRVIDFLLLQIGPETMISGKRQPMLVPAASLIKAFPYFANLPMAIRQSGNKNFVMSLGQVSLILLVDLIVSPVSIAAEKVPALLQIVLALWDHHLDVVQDSAREMLVHLIHELVISKMDDAALLNEKPAVEDFIELIRRQDPKVVWSYSEGSGLDSAFEVPEAMNFVITQTVKAFSITHPNIRDAWGQMMLDWSTSCPARLLTCRSLQMYRCILRPLNQRTISSLLTRLLIAISDSELDIQLYSLEIIRDFRGIVEHVGIDDLALVPSLFWTMCTCLESVNEGEFLEALAMLEAFLEKFDLANLDNLSLLVNSKPINWKWSPEGLTGLIYKGCKSGECLEKCLGMLDRLLGIPSNMLVGDDTRLMYSLLAFLPSLLQACEEIPVRPSYAKACCSLSEMAASHDYLVLARFLEDYANAHYQNRQDCLIDLVEAIRSDLSPKWDLPILKTLMGFLVNKLPWFKAMTLELLHAIIPEIDMQRAEIAAYGPELVSPLLGLVQTEHAPQALMILHSVMGMTGKPMDRDLLHTSLLGPSTDRKVRKDHEHTQSLYGIPESSGWAMPTPARSKDMTRSHVHEVFTTFSDGSTLGANGLPTPTQEVEFYRDDYHLRQNSLFSDHATSMSSDEATHGGTNMGVLVGELNELDDFFEVLSPELSPSHSFNNFFARSPGSSSGGTGYDTHTAASVSRNGTSLNRTTSFSSSKSGYTTDYPPPPMKLRGPPVMSPSAFSFSPKRYPRPMMHGRSVTSPVNNQKTPPERLFTVSSDEREPFSDDDVSLGRTSTSDRSFVFDHGSRPAVVRSKLSSSRLAGMKSSFRKLTGHDRQRGLARTPLDPSPEVPSIRVPAHYMMQNPRSSEL